VYRESLPDQTGDVPVIHITDEGSVSCMWVSLWEWLQWMRLLGPN